VQYPNAAPHDQNLLLNALRNALTATNWHCHVEAHAAALAKILQGQGEELVLDPRLSEGARSAAAYLRPSVSRLMDRSGLPHPKLGGATHNPLGRRAISRQEILRNIPDYDVIARIT
jgi:hypothetical protein